MKRSKWSRALPSLSLLFVTNPGRTVLHFQLSWSVITSSSWISQRNLGERWTPASDGVSPSDRKCVAVSTLMRISLLSRLLAYVSRCLLLSCPQVLS